MDGAGVLDGLGRLGAEGGCIVGRGYVNLLTLWGGCRELPDEKISLANVHVEMSLHGLGLGKFSHHITQLQVDLC